MPRLFSIPLSHIFKTPSHIALERDVQVQVQISEHRNAREREREQKANENVREKRPFRRAPTPHPKFSRAALERRSGKEEEEDREEDGLGDDEEGNLDENVEVYYPWDLSAEDKPRTGQYHVGLSQYRYQQQRRRHSSSRGDGYGRKTRRSGTRAQLGNNDRSSRSIHRNENGNAVSFGSVAAERNTLKKHKRTKTKTKTKMEQRLRVAALPPTPLRTLSSLLSHIPRALTSLTKRRRRAEDAKRRKLALQDDKRMIWVREGGGSRGRRGEWVFRTMRSYEAIEMMRGECRDESEWSWTMSM